MDIHLGKERSKTDIYDNNDEFETTDISNVFRIATAKTGNDRLDSTTISLDNINKCFCN